jgi:RimK family alpha-L-glutamate ligase
METQYKQITIVASNNSGPGVVSLTNAAHQLGYKVSIYVIGQDDVVDVIDNASDVIYRIGPISYSLYADLSNDKLQSVLNAFDKIKAYTILHAASIVMPKTWLVNAQYSYQDKPFVIKIPRGNQGNGVELIESQAALRTFFDTYSNINQFVAQEYIRQAVAKDKRLLVVGDRVVAAMERRSGSDDFRANLHLGGHAVLYEPTQQERELAIHATKALDLSYAGVDIIDSVRGPLVLEVNPSPGFGISQITGVNVEREILTYMLGVTHD